ncbi:MAG: class I tRNA ligase family protein, partial [Planctomycetota bacterium]
QYGADAVRFTLMILTTEGQDVRLAETKFELGRNFMNKVWNAARFVLTSVPEEAKDAAPGNTLPDRWIRSRAEHAIAAMTEALENYRFHDAAQALYRFVWDDFCDWYVEAAKERLQAGDLACGATLIGMLRTIVRLSQPLTPYLAAELAEYVGETEPAALLAWPEAGARDADAEARMERLQEVIRAVRRLRNENRVPERVEVDVRVKTADPEPLLEEEALLRRLARLKSLQAAVDVERPAACGVEVLTRDEVYVSLEGLIDVDAERKRKRKELDKACGHLRSIEAKLGNEKFTSKAKPEVVQRERDRAGEVRERIARLEEAMADLDG